MLKFIASECQNWSIKRICETEKLDYPIIDSYLWTLKNISECVTPNDRDSNVREMTENDNFILIDRLQIN